MLIATYIKKGIRIVARKIIVMFFSTLTSFSCFLKGICIGKNCRFHGFMTFRRVAQSYIKIGKDCEFRSRYNSNLIGINHPCIIAALAPNAKIIIGDHCGFSGTVIGAFTSIIMGNKVRCGANTTITDGDWHLDDYRSGEPKPIVIEDNVWLGLNVIVLKGVTIGKNSVIGAGSVVTKNIPANVVAAGNPCKIVKELQ